MPHLISARTTLILVLLITAVAKTNAKEVVSRKSYETTSNNDQCAGETEDLKNIIQEQNFQLEQDAKQTATLQTKVNELRSAVQQRDLHVAELSASLSRLVSLGSNCTQRVQVLQSEVETMRGNVQTARLKCRNSGKNLEMVKLETGRYYFSGDLTVNWFEAQKFCNFHGLELASVESAKENNALVQKAKDLGMPEGNYYWISGTDNGQVGRWYWASTGQDFVFSAWHPTQPDDLGGGQRCAGIWNLEGIIKWDDDYCDFKKHFICEMPQFCLDIL